jgi:hypothetical protein
MPKLHFRFGTEHMDEYETKDGTPRMEINSVSRQFMDSCMKRTVNDQESRFKEITFVFERVINAHSIGN